LRRSGFDARDALFFHHDVSIDVDVLGAHVDEASREDGDGWRGMTAGRLLLGLSSKRSCYKSGDCNRANS
jgi:hypothetical protein